MKVSKVNHTRAGVVSEKDRDYSGLIYRNPSMAGGNDIMKDARTYETAKENMEEYITGLNKTAGKLYSVFNPFVSTSKKKDRVIIEQNQYREISGCFRVFVRDLREGSSDIAVRNLLYGSSITAGLDKKYIDSFVVKYLRKSLRKTIKGRDLAEIVKKIIYLRSGLCRRNEVPEEEVRLLAEVIREDITKKKQIKKMADSIVKQDVKIQTYRDRDGKVLLRHSFADHKNKAVMYQFLQRFAAADENGQEGLLKELRALIVLFYCGPEVYKEALNNGIKAWTFGNAVSDRAPLFCEEARDLITGLEQLEPKERKAQKDIYKEKIRVSVRYKIAGSYQKAVRELQGTENFEESKIWLGLIESYAEKILMPGRRLMDPGTQDCKYLCKKTMQMLTAYIAMKLVDLGKAVYHFAMPDQIDVTNGKAVSFGAVQPAFRDGITSFDYEWIKAEESLTRELSTYSVFAVRNFLNSVSMKENDILAVNLDDANTGSLKPNAAMRVLRYFGGKSKWQDTYIGEISETELVNALRKEIGAARNSTFHYAGTIDNGITDDDKLIISQIYEKEHSDIGSIRRKKYYSNNALMFYKKEDINALMEYLYSGPKDHPAQIPAFNRILNKNKAYDHSKFLKGNPKRKIGTAGKTEELKGCVFFLLKECYYYGFLPDPRAAEFCKEALDEIVESAENEAADAKDRRLDAALNFKKRYDEISEHATLGQVCQRIMTDFELQNSGKKEVRSSKYAKKGVGEPIYQHFRMMLYDVLRKAFWNYLNKLTETGEMNFMFMREPSFKPEFEAEEKFCEGWMDHSYDDIREGLEENTYLEAWFTTAHFIAPAQLNHLIGSFKKYEQFTGDIAFRAQDNGIDFASRWENGTEISEMHRLLRVLEFVQMSNGTFSKEIGDYFGKDEDSAIEEYAEFVGGFVDFSVKKMPNNHVALQTFCSTPVKAGSPTGKLGIYYDGENPILNRNILMADMFGNVRQISACLKKVGEAEILRFYSDREKLAEVFKKGICQNTDEQENLKAFQNNKNRIELLDVAIYTEILNELYAQLVSWSYLRERDLMYYQLGVHYMRLFYGDTVPAESYLRKLQGNSVNIEEGAVLYQFTAMNSFGWDLLCRDGSVDENATTTGTKVASFYKNYCNKDASVYNCGLMLFERLQSHDAIVNDLRNPIDHMHYFEKTRKGAKSSILELYSDVYDRYFDYDVKLKKSVSFILKNILLDHFVIAHIEMNRKEGKYVCKVEKKGADKAQAAERSYVGTELAIRPNKEDVKKVKDKQGKIKEVSFIRYGLESDLLTYKIKEDGNNVSVPVDARSRIFLDQLKRILEYKKA